MVFGYHLVWTAYGWWLPNDPRGSMSHQIASDVIAELGQLHYGRKQVQPAGWVIRKFYEHAAPVLKFDLREFSRSQIARIAESFAGTVRRQNYTCYACAIMPDHVHLLIRKHRDPAPEMIARLQADSRTWLLHQGGSDPMHPVWGGPGWVVFLDHPDDFRRTVGYIEGNPTKARIPRQTWEFVIPYDGWPLHPGHNPNSPHARAIRGGS
ncbi:MAG: transposase [Phycisphaerae bacterium]|nr:transposase [Phycisphaerae bacterium]